MNGPTYSFVIPLLDEEQVLGELHRRLCDVADSLDGSSEFILIDDGSSDQTREIAAELHAQDSRMKLVVLSRNFGHQLAISAGLDFASGDAIVIMDGDLQDPPELVPALAERWREGYDVVYALRASRAGETRFRRGAAAFFYRLIGRLTNIDLPPDTGDFRLVDRRAARIVANMREPDRYLRGMFAWVGFRQTAVPYDRAARYAGEGKYSIRRLMQLASDGLLSFTTAPLRLTLAGGLAIACLAFGAGVAAVVLGVLGVLTLPGWASLMIVLGLFSGIQLIVLGTIGIYVGRIYIQGKERPLYLVDSALGFGNRESTSHSALWQQTDPAAHRS
jgi:glycosyltransferase involved in cell wall biosynthesis